MILETFLIVGAIMGGAALVHFWDDIKNWLNQVAGDAVERLFGYQARQNIHKAVAIIDRVVNKIKNTSVIYSKKSPTATYFDKTTVTAETGIQNVEADVLKELSKNGNRLTQEFSCLR